MQFSVVHASVITVHKSQGATYSDVVYEYDRGYSHRLVYIALSRCTDVNRLYLTNAKGDHPFYHAQENLDHDLLDEFRRLDKHHLPTVTKACALNLAEPQYSFPLAALNVSIWRLSGEGDVSTQGSLLEEMFLQRASQSFLRAPAAAYELSSDRLAALADNAYEIFSPTVTTCLRDHRHFCCFKVRGAH
ncbi:hypothetical protein HPB49_000625 [Dermacentor silvarum]|uniref:Uncharacterized protein n=1 Tax=Dermacentor silvarum TaxID=543639 RepID=A0ACB8CNF1_DERSI|nr:hypothetical protein HPB49_000625 [Dermacentor silvarum]